MAIYYLRRLSLTIKSWVFWVNIPADSLHLYDRELYWSQRKKGVTVAANFWCMLNDGAMDMEFEFYDT